MLEIALWQCSTEYENENLISWERRKRSQHAAVESLHAPKASMIELKYCGYITNSSVPEAVE
jgi:hypothetical protein